MTSPVAAPFSPCKPPPAFAAYGQTDVGGRRGCRRLVRYLVGEKRSDDNVGRPLGWMVGCDRWRRRNRPARSQGYVDAGSFRRGRGKNRPARSQGHVDAGSFGSCREGAPGPGPQARPPHDFARGCAFLTVQTAARPCCVRADRRGRPVGLPSSGAVPRWGKAQRRQRRAAAGLGGRVRSLAQNEPACP
jgi:hypothetical protein